jgi:hypothetical protein
MELDWHTCGGHPKSETVHRATASTPKVSR